LHLPKGALLNDAGISVRLGQKIMGKVHADTPCVLRRPEYNKDGWFSIGGVDFVQLCLGEHAVKSEEFVFTQSSPVRTGKLKHVYYESMKRELKTRPI
jgi:hypothetical protein